MTSAISKTFSNSNYQALRKVGFTRAQAFVLLKLFTDVNPYSAKIDNNYFQEKLDELLGEENEQSNTNS